MAVPLRVLIVEDNESDAGLMLRELAKDGFDPRDPQRVETADDLRRALAERTWDVILCDYHLPQLDTLMALDIYHESDMDIPFIVVSGTIGEDIAVDMMRRGAHDYLLKDKMTRLAPAVRRELREAVERRERKSAEAALRESEERYRDQASLLDLAHDAIIVRGMDDRVVYWNRGAERLYGWMAEEMIGRNVRELMYREHARYDAAKRELLERGEWSGELSHVTKSGALITVNGRWSLVRDPLGRPKSILIINTDITQRRRLEEQLLQSQKMEAIGRLAGGVAHDFNNLLTVILGFAQMQLMRDDLDSATRADLNQILQAAEGASSLTRQLLTFSRKSVMQASEMDLGVAVNKLARMLQRIIGEDVQLVICSAPNLPPINADPGMIEQVVLNLAVNSRDAMTRGGRLNLSIEPIVLLQAELATHPRGRPGRYVVLEVRDTGCGMPPEVLNRLFEPFFTTKEVGKGTGLGLATVYGIVEQHEGWVEVESEVGAGSTFRVYLPVKGKKDEAPAKPPADQKIPGGHETLLLVEDEVAVRSMVRDFLSNLGYRVLEAGSGPAARELWAEHGPTIDLLITDIVMPGGISGPELAADLQAERPGLRVIYSSGYSDDTGADSIVLREGINFIRKPFNLRRMAEILRRRLDHIKDDSTS